MQRRHSDAPPRRSMTVREAIREELRRGPADARRLSVAVGVRERDVPEHLAHLARSLERAGEHLVVDPAACASCGYVFAQRTRLSRPSACPRCRGTHIDPPAFRIEPAR